MPAAPGIVVLDTNCWRRLRESQTLATMLRSTRAVDLEVWPTGINLLEIARNTHPVSRTADLATIRRIAEVRGGVLPLPDHILLQAAKAIASQRLGFWSGTSVLEELLDHDFPLKPEIYASIVGWLHKLDSNFETVHARARPAIQAKLKEHGLAKAWSTPASFLDEYWMRVELHDSGLDGWWKRFGLASPAPYAEVLADAVWRLFLELEGVAVYERGVMANQPKWVHFSDLIQLLYLAGSRRRVLVTDDGPLQRAASALLTGRHPGARVMSWGEFAATF